MRLKKKQSLWKRNIAVLLSLVLIAQFVLTMPLVVRADEPPTDWTAQYVDANGPIENRLKITLPNEGPVDPTISLRVDLLTIPVQGDGGTPFGPIKDGDYIEFTLAENFKLSQSPQTFTAYHGEDQAAVLTLSNDAVTSDGKYPLKAKIVFTGADSIYEDPGATKVFAWFDLNLTYDATGGETGDGITYTIKILDKIFTINYPPNYSVTKSAEGASGAQINFADKTITWTVTINGIIQDPTIGAPLKGYTFEDNLTNVGDYVLNSFKIGDNPAALVAPTTDPRPEMDKILKYAFANDDKAPKPLLLRLP